MGPIFLGEPSKTLLKASSGDRRKPATSVQEVQTLVAHQKTHQSVDRLIIQSNLFASNVWVANYGSLLSYRFLFWDHFWILIALFGVRRGFKMILSQRATCCLNMSSYSAIWTHFRPNFIFFNEKCQILVSKVCFFPKMLIFSSSRSHKKLTYTGV